MGYNLSLDMVRFKGCSYYGKIFFTIKKNIFLICACVDLLKLKDISNLKRKLYISFLLRFLIKMRA